MSLYDRWSHGAEFSELNTALGRIPTAMWWGVGLILLALLAGASSAAYVPPETWWFLQIIGIALGAIEGLVVFWGAIAVTVRRWWLGGALLSSMALAVAMPLMNYLASPSQQGRFSPRELEGSVAVAGGAVLKVVSFNAKPARLSPRVVGVAALLEDERPHFVAMQELNVRIDRSSGVASGPPFLESFYMGDRYVVSWPESEEPESDEVVIYPRPIMSRIESVGGARIIPGNQGGGIRQGLWSSGGATRQEYLWQGQRIVVYNIHLHSFSGNRPWEEGWRRMFSLGAWEKALRAYRTDFRTRAEQARMIRRLIDAETRPFLVLGDFNSTPGSWVYAHLSRGLHDAFGRAGSGWGATFPARIPLIRIDFILASKEWEVRRAHTSSTVVSDHVPVVAELVLK